MSGALKVVIAGGGIGGLTLAGLLARRGIEVLVCEQSAALGEIGAGVQMSPNAVKVLRALGIEDALHDSAFAPEHFTGWDWKSGRKIYQTPIKHVYERLYGAPYLHVHRADLHALLVSAVPANRIRLNARVAEVVQRDDHVEVRLADGEVIACDVLVGADGIHSAVRKAVFGDAPARFTGNMCWRGMVPTDVLPPGLVPPTASNWLGPEGHVVHYYLRRGAMVNFVAVRETSNWTEESWTSPSSREELMSAFKGWNPRLLTLFEHASGVFKWGLFDRDPLDAWSRGGVTLLGDAAHPMLPFLAQGAAQAIEDAYALADWLAQPGIDPQAALKLYEHERLGRTARVQLGARARSRTMHLASPLARLKRNMRFRWQSIRDPEGTSHQAEWIYSHDVTAVRRTAPAEAALTV